jgi:hypothetical protein
VNRRKVELSISRSAGTALVDRLLLTQLTT